MAVFIIRRLLWLPFVLLFISLVTFWLGLVVPGNPIQVMMGLHANPATIERLTQEYGFDQPFYVQYLRYVTNALQGNFGYGLVKYRDQPVGRLIGEALPVTIELNIVALVLGIAVGIPLGLIVGLVRNPWVDGITRFVLVGIVSIPVIFLNPVLAFVFSARHEVLLPFLNFNIVIGPILPFVGGHWDGIFSTKTILPALIESLGVMFGLMRFLRAGVIEELNKDYVRTARAKGLGERFVIVNHAMRNALLPIATSIGFAIGSLVVGSFLVESFFGIPGIGALAFDAFVSREYYLIMGVTILIAISYVIANLLADMSYHFLDPRIRLGNS
jgi:peptide/nickel transport system permease protein